MYRILKSFASGQHPHRLPLLPRPLRTRLLLLVPMPRQQQQLEVAILPYQPLHRLSILLLPLQAVIRAFQVFNPRRQSGGSLALSDTSNNKNNIQTSPTLSQLEHFFSQDWVRHGTPEILYIKRASRSSDRWSAQVAFPGGRQEPDDENSLYTAMRETWEEVGIDLAEKKDFLEVGRLDDREITTSLGKRLLMVLSPFGGSFCFSL